ncbi:ATP-binding protein [Athalassotoga sp.]|uniref:ATP-binding protein n=1 Tax=Athalassotoga sp. TaxID=2022597 RepID=UPI003D061F5B
MRSETLDQTLSKTLSKGQNLTTGRIFRASSTNDALNRCAKECIKPDNCDGLVRYTVPEYGEMVFANRCPIFEKYKQIIQRKAKVEKILGPLAVHTFQNYDKSRNVKAYEISRKYVERRAWEVGGWLILYGGYGTGKTHLLSAIIQEAIMMGVYASFSNLAKISTMGFEESKSELSKLVEYDLLGLDDFGIESSQNWLTPHIFKLFDDLNEGKKGLVMTTNMSLKGLQELLGERISDRITERAIAIELTGESMRKSLRKGNVSWADGGDENGIYR